MERIILFLIIGISTAAYTKPAVVIGPYQAVQREFSIKTDPSMFALTNEYQTVSAPKPFKERWRIMSDLNGDGVNDLILSESMDALGRATVSWMVYLHKKDLWRYIGDIEFHPDVVAIESTDKGINIWNYLTNSGSDGFFGYYHVSNEKLGSKPMQILVSTSDNENSIFSRINTAIFKSPNTHPFILEKSSTSTNGIVSWKKIRDHRTASCKNEVCELKQKLIEAEKRANVAETKLQQISYKLCEYERSVHQLCGITLGAAWEGGEKNRPCEEIFTGFTNLTVSVNKDNLVESIRLTRNDDSSNPLKQNLRNAFEPTEEEQKIIHQVENQFKIRFQKKTNSTYSWGGPISGTWIDIHFANDGESTSYIEMRYSRKFRK